MERVKVLKLTVVLCIVACVTSNSIDDIQSLMGFVNQQQTDDNLVPSDSDPFEKDSLRNQLERLRAQQINCIKITGVSEKGFDTCCGKNYDVVSDLYLNIYNRAESDLVKEFSNDLQKACQINQDPCNELADAMKTAILDSDNKYQEVVAKADQIKDMPGVEDNILEGAIGSFKQKYDLFRQTRLLIATFLFDTVRDIERYIDTSNIQTTFDYHEFNPLKVFDILGVVEKNEFAYIPQTGKLRVEKYNTITIDSVPSGEEHEIAAFVPVQHTLFVDESSSTSYKNTLAQTEVINRKALDTGNKITLPSTSNLDTSARRKMYLKPLISDNLSLDDKLEVIIKNAKNDADPAYVDPVKQVKSNSSKDFNSGLLAEIKAHQLLNYYLAKGILSKDSVDLSQLPSVVLKTARQKKLINDSRIGA